MHRSGSLPRGTRTRCLATALATALVAALTASGAAATTLRTTSAASAAGQPDLVEATTLTCDGPSANGLVETVTPRNCSILYPNLSLLGGVQMQDLHWSHWGARTATATGISHGFHDGGAYPIRVRVWGLAHAGCERSGYWYTRLSISSEGDAWSKPYITSYC